MSQNFNILVTGGAGFIGSALSRYLIENTNHQVIILDKLTYASNIDSISSIKNKKKVNFYHGCIGDVKLVDEILNKYKPMHIYNLAAETHVDNSIKNPFAFIQTNVVDTHKFLHNTLKYFQELSKSVSKFFRFLQISTDEVYGDIDFLSKPVKETASFNPSSTYSATKASGDHLIKAYFRTYGFPGIISNCSNNYGPYQNREKFIPLILFNLLKKKKIPVYGNGQQIRDWLYVEDHCEALLKIMAFGKNGENYNIGNNTEITNIDLIEKIILILKKKSIIEDTSINNYVEFVEDRLGHDKRYALNSDKIKSQCNWKPKVNFESGLNKTISFYLNAYKR